ncbi:hypothetical protein Bbelb_364060 [Branchiostoma belcheri]|nr:hypothetical protein Bbelb_364060 [Branchiostoma belcheri]
MALQFLSKPIGGPNLCHLFPSTRPTYHPNFVTLARPDHEISKPEVQLHLAARLVDGGPVMPILSMTLPIASKLCFENAKNCESRPWLVSALRPGNSRGAVRTESEPSCLRIDTWWRR